MSIAFHFLAEDKVLRLNKKECFFQIMKKAIFLTILI